MQCSCRPNFTDGMLVMQEARAKDMISQLKLEMNNLTRLVEAGAGLSIGEESTMNELLKQKEDLTKERDAQVQPHPHDCTILGGSFQHQCVLTSWSDTFSVLLDYCLLYRHWKVC